MSFTSEERDTLIMKQSSWAVKILILCVVWMGQVANSSPYLRRRPRKDETAMIDDDKPAEHHHQILSQRTLFLETTTGISDPDALCKRGLVEYCEDGKGIFVHQHLGFGCFHLCMKNEFLADWWANSIGGCGMCHGNTPGA